MDYNELKERTESLTGVDIDELIERVRLLSVEYGTQKAKVEHMTDFRKAKLYSIIEERRAEFQEVGEKVTEARLEAIARASIGYKEYLERQYHEKVALVEKEAAYFAARNKLDSLMEMMKFARNEMYMTNRN